MLNYAQLQADVHGLDKKSAVDYLHETHPHKSKSFFNRYYNHLMALDPLGLYRFIGHSDPTATKAINNIMKEGVAA